MIQNNNLTPLAFYDSEEQRYHRKSYAYGAIYNLFCPQDVLLPFQIIREHRANKIASVKLYKCCGELVDDITEMIVKAGLVIKEFPQQEYDVIIYTALLPLGINMEVGAHYLEISDGVQTWTSEMFTSVSTTSGYVCVEWWSEEDFIFDGGRIVYEGVRYHNIVYLNTQVGKPEYRFEEEGETRDGYFFPEKQISEKVFKFAFIAPEYLCDALRFVRMSDNVIITDELGREYDCDTFLMTVKWQTQGDLASVEAEFETATVAKKIGKAQLISGNGDFNADYNADYNITGDPTDVITVTLSVTGEDDEIIKAVADTTVMYDVRVQAIANGGQGTGEIDIIIPAGQNATGGYCGLTNIYEITTADVKATTPKDTNKYTVKIK